MPEDTFAVLSAAEHEQLLEIARMMLAALGERSPRLKQHSERVADACANFCESAGILTDDDLYYLYLAGLLHDAGLIAAPGGGSLGEGLPSPEGDAQQIKKHPVDGVRILSPVQRFAPLLAAVRHHHEAWDGSGYPDGKRGEEIPLEARVIRLFDAFDDLTSTYRRPQGLSIGEALAAIQEKAGEQFDPGLLPAFKAFVESSPGPGANFMLRKQSDFVKRQLPSILQKFSAGKILPPAMPQVVFELRSAIKRQEATVKDVALILEKDPVISLRLISVANSPVYKGHGEILSVKAAIPRLGFKETLSIVVAIANKSLYEAKQPQFKAALDRMWGHSLASAYASRLFAQALALEDPETLFLMGLTHDVGKVVLLRAFAETPSGNHPNIDAILAAIQEAHQPIGTMLLKRWGFGEEFQQVVSLHEGAVFTAQTSKKLLVVHLANLLARKMGHGSVEWDGGDLAEQPSASLLGLTTDAIARVEETVQAVIKDIAHLF